MHEFILRKIYFYYICKYQPIKQINYERKKININCFSCDCRCF